uniref:Uncharacterized protein n=1 Tax=Rangifer tarandus platyrhynchus TaxID=3082113 RepID=A0ACB0EIY3_RANTA|nr:unnamed protein product [Rangifer tarandus platyrhynchus]
MAPAAWSAETQRPPHVEPSPHLPVDTIKGSASPSASVSRTGKPGTRTGKLPRFLLIKGGHFSGVFISLQEEAKTPLSSGPSTAQRPGQSSVQPGQLAPILLWQAGQAWALAQKGPGRQRGSRHSALLEPCPSYSHKWSRPPDGRLLAGL